jgi:hypothetical protein
VILEDTIQGDSVGGTIQSDSGRDTIQGDSVGGTIQSDSGGDTIQDYSGGTIQSDSGNNIIFLCIFFREIPEGL